MGTEVRVGEDKPKYDFYENALFLDDPLEADISRKARCLAPKIGTQPRFSGNNLEHNPGPQYLPKEKRLLFDSVVETQPFDDVERV